MCTSVVNGDVLACSPFCACDSPVCMPWCGEMQCAKEDVGDPDRDMLKNPSCTGCADVDPPVHCQSAGDFKTTAAPASKGPNGGKLIGEEEAEEEDEEEEGEDLRSSPLLRGQGEFVSISLISHADKPR